MPLTSIIWFYDLIIILLLDLYVVLFFLGFKEKFTNLLKSTKTIYVGFKSYVVILISFFKKAILSLKQPIVSDVKIVSIIIMVNINLAAITSNIPYFTLSWYSLLFILLLDLFLLLLFYGYIRKFLIYIEGKENNDLCIVLFLHFLLYIGIIYFKIPVYCVIVFEVISILVIIVYVFSVYTDFYNFLKNTIKDIKSLIVHYVRRDTAPAEILDSTKYMILNLNNM